jgi:hypothetical protein
MVHVAAATNALPVHALARVRVKKTQSLRVALVLVARDQRVGAAIREEDVRDER